MNRKGFTMTTTLELHPYENGYVHARQDTVPMSPALLSLQGHEYVAGYLDGTADGYDVTVVIRVGRLRTAWRMFRRALRCAHSLARSKALPWWLRVMLVIGCIQIPVLPVDEIFLATALGIIAVFYRSTLRAAWTESAR